MSELEEYVRNQLKAGYTKEQVKKFLLKYYPSKTIETAMRKSTSKGLMWLSIFAVLLVVAAGLIIMKQNSLPETPLSITATIAPEIVVQGEEFIATITAADSIKTKHPVTIIAKLTDKAGTVLTEQKDFIVVSGTGKRTKAIKPVMAPGEYFVIITATSQKERAQTTASFTILKPQTGSQAEPAQVREKKEYSATKEGYLERCADEMSDECYSQAAAIYSDKTLCSKISTDEVKDSCLFFFYLHGDNLVCGEIKESAMKESCKEVLPDSATESSSEDTIRVSISMSSFVPSRIEAGPGATITWFNEDSVLHTVVGNLFSSQALEQGDPFSFTFDKPGSYDYHCSIHPEMKGTIVIH
ncbi:cupredoxin domain-containing protein [Candidatus Woesearchaeota archaeon]|nr:cupredoxin domain-containing protein [Candidatus Woesearchaeota archaeon]